MGNHWRQFSRKMLRTHSIWMQILIRSPFCKKCEHSYRRFLKFYFPFILVKICYNLCFQLGFYRSALCNIAFSLDKSYFFISRENCEIKEVGIEGWRQVEWCLYDQYKKIMRKKEIKTAKKNWSNIQLNRVWAGVFEHKNQWLVWREGRVE